MRNKSSDLRRYPRHQGPLLVRREKESKLKEMRVSFLLTFKSESESEARTDEGEEFHVFQRMT